MEIRNSVAGNEFHLEGKFLQIVVGLFPKTKFRKMGCQVAVP
jgi:hypothetical protein